jgi:DNA-binding transcriptional MerR regulator
VLILRKGTRLDLQTAAFTSDQALRLTGASRRRLGYWVDTRLISPSIQRGEGRGRVRLFSFANLLELRTAVWLRDKVSLQLIRKIVQRCRSRGLINLSAP